MPAVLHPRNQPVSFPVRLCAQNSQCLFFQLENEESRLCCIQEISQFRSLFGSVPKIRNAFFFNLKTKKASCVAFKKSASFAPCSAQCPKFAISFFFNLKTKKAGCVAVFIKGQLWNKISFCTFFDFLSFTGKD